MTTPISSGPAIKELALRMPPKEAKIPLKKIPGTAKGFADFSLEEQIVFKEWKEIIDNTFALFGFDPLDLPPFVHRKFLLVKGGVEAQIFSVNHLSDNSQTKYGIAFDRTVPFALWIRDNLKKLSFPFKRRDISLSFRAESTRTGRLNGFYQADIDTVGRNLPLTCDAECITVLVSALSQIKSVPSFEVYLNHIEIPKHLIKKAGFTNLEEALRVIDKLDKTPPEQIVAELCQLEPSVSCKEIEQIVSVCSFRGSFKDFQQMSLSLERSSVYIEQVAKVISLVQKAGVNPDLIKFAPGIVRGLNYYTGIVFETFIKDYPQFGSIASGGRYDELVDTFAETKTGIQGVGGSIGLSRLFQVLNFHQAIPKEVKTAAKVLVLMREFELTEKATEVASWLRESKVATQLYLGTLKGIQKQLQSSFSSPCHGRKILCSTRLSSRQANS